MVRRRSGIMDRKQDSNVTSTSAGTSGPSAQDFGSGLLLARGLGRGAKKRRTNEEENK